MSPGLNTTFAALVDPFEMSGPAVSKHLKVLERTRPDRARPRSAMETMPLRRGPLKDATEWLGHYRRCWGG
jgi:hypothetical protein